MSEESEKVERTKMRYPKGRMVVVRDSTIPVCNNNNPGAVLLSVLLFWYDNPHTGDSYDEKEQTFTLCRTQAEIEEQACHQIDVKTIHRTAVPLLQLFSYLTVKEKMNGNIYILHMDRIFAAYAAYEKSAETLKNFLKSSLQLDKCPIKIPESQLDKILINKTNVQLQLDKILIANRQMSNCKRGRKPKSERDLEAISEETENLRESREKSNEREGEHEQSVTTPIASALSLDAALSSSPQSENETQYQQGDTHGSILPAGDPDLHRALERPTAPGTTQDAPGHSHGVTRPQQQDVETRPQPGTPIPPAPALSSPPSSEVHVLIVTQQFTSIEQWKTAQDGFIETLRGVWKQSGSDFKKQYGNWHGYRKQHLDRWLNINPQPTEESLLVPEARRIWQDWQTNYKRPIPLTTSDKQALTMLVPSQPTREELKMCRGWLFSTDDPNKPWYRKIGVSLLDCAKNWGKWQSLQEPPEQHTRTRTLTREELRRIPV